MRQIGGAQKNCPECGHELQPHEFKLSILDGLGLGCLGEIAIWTVVILLGALISTLAFDTAYLIGILVVVLGAVIAASMYRRYVCPACERVYKKGYLRELKQLEESKEREERLR